MLQVCCRSLQKERNWKTFEKNGVWIQKQIVSVPAWRTDVLHEVDIIEDIAIAYGYDKFSPEIPELSTVGEELKKNKLKFKISEILTGLNLLEVSSYHLIKPSEAKKTKQKIY